MASTATTPDVAQLQKRVQELEAQLAAARADVAAATKAATAAAGTPTAASPPPLPPAPGRASKADPADPAPLDLAKQIETEWTAFTSAKAAMTGLPSNASRRPVNVAAWAALDAIVYVLQEGLGDRLTGYSSLPNERPSGAPVHSTTLTVTSDDVQILAELLQFLSTSKSRRQSLVAAAGTQSPMHDLFKSMPKIFDRHTQQYMLSIMTDQHPAQQSALLAQRASMIKAAASWAQSTLTSPSTGEVTRSHAATTGMETWSYNIFNALAMLSKGGKGGSTPVLELFALIGMASLQALGVIAHFKLNGAVLAAYLAAIADKYNDNPYHNALHGADVCQSLFYFVASCGLESHLSMAQKLAAMLAALVHDVGHMARTNGFLVLTQHELALRYNDKSCLENMHVATAFSVMQDDDKNLLKPLPQKIRVQIRKTMIDMVLATDNASHTSLTDRLNECIEAGGPNLRSVDADARLTLSVALHVADVSNPAKAFDLYEVWTERIMQEFFDEGDELRALGQEVPRMNDRTNPIPVAKMQAGFIHMLVMPLYELFAELPMVDIGVCLKQLRANLAHWESSVQDGAAAAAGAGGGAGAGAGAADASPTGVVAIAEEGEEDQQEQEDDEADDEGARPRGGSLPPLGVLKTPPKSQ